MAKSSLSTASPRLDMVTFATVNSTDPETSRGTAYQMRSVRAVTRHPSALNVPPTALPRVLPRKVSSR
jgi:hypothetical protein